MQAPSSCRPAGGHQPLHEAEWYALQQSRSMDPPIPWDMLVGAWPVLFPAAPRRTSGQLQLAFEIGAATSAQQRAIAGARENGSGEATAQRSCCITPSRPTTSVTQTPAPAAEEAAAAIAAAVTAALEPALQSREEADMLDVVEACQLGSSSRADKDEDCSSHSDKDEDCTDQYAGADVNSMTDMEGEDIEGQDSPQGDDIEGEDITRSTHECVICFEHKEQGTGAHFNCSHSGQFCARCIAKLQMPSCPLCRRALVKDLTPWFRRVVRHHDTLEDKTAHLDLLAAATTEACASTPPLSLLKPITVEALRAIGVSDLTFAPYIKALQHTVLRHRVVHLMCVHMEAQHVLLSINRRGLGEGLAESAICLTSPLWITDDGEVPPAAIAHETMCKPFDLRNVTELPEKEEASTKLRPLFLTHEEAYAAYLASTLITEDMLEGVAMQPGTLAYDVEKEVRKLMEKPIWSMIHADLREVAFGHLEDQGLITGGAGGSRRGDAVGAMGAGEVWSQEERVAALFYLSCLSANAAHAANISDSLGVIRTAGMQTRSSSELNNRLLNFHAPHWLLGPMKRAHLASLSSMATSDSIPVCASVDVDKLSNPLKAALYSGFLQCNRVLFTEVCSDQTYIVNDSCSDTKLATIPYETGVTPNPPLEQDIISILNPTASKNKLEQATKACLPHQHPLRKFGKLLFYANSRTGAKTGTAHLNKKATLPSSHFSRLNAVHWVAMCWIQGKPCKVMGAFAVGMTGGSPQGNQAEPTNLCHLPLEEARAGYLAASEQAFLLLQEYHTIVTNLHLGDEYTRVVKAEESLKSATRSVESWIKHQSIQSSDLEALARAAYKYMPPLNGGQHPVMQHVCLSEAAAPPPPTLPH